MAFGLPPAYGFPLSANPPFPSVSIQPQMPVAPALEKMDARFVNPFAVAQNAQSWGMAGNYNQAVMLGLAMLQELMRRQGRPTVFAIDPRYPAVMVAPHY